MCVALLMPEFLVGRALGDYIAARRFMGCPAMARFEQKGWTKTHGFYANMGGFILQDPVDGPLARRQSTASRTAIESSKLEAHRELRHRCSWKVLKNFYEDTYEIPFSGAINLPVAINGEQVCALLNRGLIDESPPMGKDEIMDKSKANILGKCIALGQFTWIVIELASRNAQGLPSTQLEVMAISFAVCTFITHLMWFGKPQDVQVHSNVTLLDHLQEDEKKILHRLAGKTSFFTNGLLAKKRDIEPSEFIPNDIYLSEADLYTFRTGWVMTGEDLGFILGAITLGACHCIAWSYGFPTPLERTLWRASSIAVIGVMPMYYLIWLFMDVLGWDGGGATETLSRICYTLYVVPRLYLLVAPFRDLFYLPPQAFIATWSASIPHVS